MAKIGRPKKEINKKQFENLCAIQCTREEICAVLDVTEKTIDKWCHDTYGEPFSLVFKQKREGGKASLRRNQWLLSASNPTMAIWLGKQYLGQKDHAEVENTNSKVDDVVKALNRIANGSDT